MNKKVRANEDHLARRNDLQNYLHDIKDRLWLDVEPSLRAQKPKSRKSKVPEIVFKYREDMLINSFLLDDDDE